MFVSQFINQNYIQNECIPKYCRVLTKCGTILTILKICTQIGISLQSQISLSVPVKENNAPNMAKSKVCSLYSRGRRLQLFWKAKTDSKPLLCKDIFYKRVQNKALQKFSLFTLVWVKLSNTLLMAVPEIFRYWHYIIYAIYKTSLVLYMAAV